MKFKELFDVIGEGKLVEVHVNGVIAKAGFKTEMKFSQFDMMKVTSFVAKDNETVVINVREGE